MSERIEARKVLIITYYWPPSGGPGVRRILKFVKYLGDFGWEPFILTVKDGEYPNIDETLIDEIPGGLEIFQTKTWEPYHFYRWLSGKKSKANIPTYILNRDDSSSLLERITKSIRGNIFIPDARIGWIPFAVKRGREIIAAHDIDLIFSSGPPHTVHLIAHKIARKTGLKWVADFRDPWTDVFYYKDLKRFGWAIRIDQYLEKKVLKNATAITTVSPSIAELLKHKIKNNYFVLPSGFDESDFDGIQSKKPNKFRITYLGNLASSQNPEVFFQALAEMSSTNADFKSDLELQFAGNVHPVILASLEKNKLSQFTKIFPYIPHDQVVHSMASAQILLLIIPEYIHNEGILTGKLFDYMGAKKFILGIGPPQGDAAAILQETSQGRMISYSDLAGMKELLVGQYYLWKKQTTVTRSSDSKVKKYCFKDLTAKLANIFNELI